MVKDKQHSLAAACSGCGETLMEAFFARTFCDALRRSESMTAIIDNVSRQYEEAARKNVGVIALDVDRHAEELRFCVARNTMAFGVGYRYGKKQVARIDRSSSYCSEVRFSVRDPS